MTMDDTGEGREEYAIPEAADGSPLAADEFYFDGPYLVFTAVYHLKRGYCCNSECRDCPYR